MKSNDTRRKWRISVEVYNGEGFSNMINSLDVWSTCVWIIGRVKRRQIFEVRI